MTLIKKHEFLGRPEAEIFAAEQRAKGAEAWVVPSNQGYVVTVRVVKL